MDIIKFKNKDYLIKKKLSNNKLLVTYKNKDFIIVPFDTYMAFSNYVDNKKRLKKNKVEMPKIIKKDKKALLVLEQYIEGESLLKVIAENRLDEKKYEELFRIYRNNRFAKIALSLKPENFIQHKKYFYYISEEIAPIKNVVAFERSDDILLWMNTENQKRYIEAKGYSYLDRTLLKEGGELNKQIALLCVAHW